MDDPAYQNPLIWPRLTHYNPKPDPLDRWLFGGFGVLCVIWGIVILGLLVYGAISTIVAAV